MLRNILLVLLLLIGAPCYGQVTKIPIWGEFANSDSTAATLTETTARISLYKMVAGVPTAVTLAATDVVELSDISAGVSGTGTLTIYSGSDDTLAAGEQMFKSTHAVGSLTATISFRNPPQSIPGTYPKVETSVTGSTIVFVRGYIVKTLTSI